jgi:hypothetical protein
MYQTRLASGVLISFALGGLLLARAIGGTNLSPELAQAKAEKSGENKFIGADKCKNCHTAESSGNQWAAWREMDHARL